MVETAQPDPGSRQRQAKAAAGFLSDERLTPRQFGRRRPPVLGEVL
jgi:hypothetical protein